LAGVSDVPENFIVYIWTGRLIQASVSTDDREFAGELEAWAKSQGYRVEYSLGDEPHGSDEQ
jgi:hypothetical protein